MAPVGHLARVQVLFQDLNVVFSVDLLFRNKTQ